MPTRFDIASGPRGHGASRLCPPYKYILHYSANATGLLNSDVAPALDVTVAVNDGGTAECSVTGMASEKLAAPPASETTLVSARKISPSVRPAWRFANTSTVSRDSPGAPRTGRPQESVASDSYEGLRKSPVHGAAGYRKEVGEERLQVALFGFECIGAGSPALDSHVELEPSRQGLPPVGWDEICGGGFHRL